MRRCESGVLLFLFLLSVVDRNVYLEGIIVDVVKEVGFLLLFGLFLKVGYVKFCERSMIIEFEDKENVWEIKFE